MVASARVGHICLKYCSFPCQFTGSLNPFYLLVGAG
jgi:hypothetical protein